MKNSCNVCWFGFRFFWGCYPGASMVSWPPGPTEFDDDYATFSDADLEEIQSVCSANPFLNETLEEFVDALLELRQEAPWAADGLNSLGPSNMVCSSWCGHSWPFNERATPGAKILWPLGLVRWDMMGRWSHGKLMRFSNWHSMVWIFSSIWAIILQQISTTIYGMLWLKCLLRRQISQA